MGAIISLGDRWIKISNGACEKVFDDAITVAEYHAATDSERKYIERLKHERQGFFPGYCPDFESLFPTFEEREFWIRCFRDAGRWLHEGRLDNPPGGGASPAMWIFHTYWCAELLQGTLRQADRSCMLDDQDTTLRAQARERYLAEHRIKHEAVMAKEQEEIASSKEKIREYCNKHGIVVPAGFDRRRPLRYAVVRRDVNPPKLVAVTWAQQKDVICYIEGLQINDAINEAIDILDFGDAKRMRYGESGILEVMETISQDETQPGKRIEAESGPRE